MISIKLKRNSGRKLYVNNQRNFSRMRKLNLKKRILKKLDREVFEKPELKESSNFHISKHTNEIFTNISNIPNKSIA